MNIVNIIDVRTSLNLLSYRNPSYLHGLMNNEIFVMETKIYKSIVSRTFIIEFVSPLKGYYLSLQQARFVHPQIIRYIVSI